MKNLLPLLILTSGTSFTMAAFTPVTTITVSDVGSVRTLQSITIGSDTYPAISLGTGTTSQVGGTPPSNIANMDSFNLNSLATPFTGATSVRTINFGGAPWTKVDSKPLDFFIFEGAGSANPDDIQIAAILPGGTLGATVTAPTTIDPAGWGNTGLSMSGGQQNGQALAGLAWSITDLKDEFGNALTASSTIEGIAIVGGFGVDVAGFYAVVPPPAIFYDKLEVSASVSSEVVDVPFDVTITAKDSNNVTINDSTLTVTVSSPTAGSLMEFDWNSDGTYGDASGTLNAGVKTIKARNRRAQTVAISAAQGTAATPAPPSVTTVAGAFVKLQTLVPGENANPGTTTGKTGAPSGQLQSVPFSVSVRAVDAFWNLVSSADLIGITSSDSLATLPANASLAAGTVSFLVTLNQAAEPYTITATNLTNGGITAGVSAPITTTVFYRWLGDGSSNAWDTSTANWAIPPSSTPVPFADSSLAVFDDLGSANPGINIGTVSPTGVTVNSATKHYIFEGTGIGGAATLTKAGTSTLRLTVDNTHTGNTTVTGGLLKLESQFALPGGTDAAGGTSALILNGGILGLDFSDFYRSLGTGAINVRLAGTNSGFAAFNGDKTVNLGELGAAVTWPSANFLPSASDVFVLGHPDATDTVTFENIIDFGSGGNRTVRVDDGSAPVDGKLLGRMQDSSASPGNLVKTGSGTLQISAANNNYEGSTQIQNGTVVLTGSIYVGTSTALSRSVILGNGTTSGILQLGNESIAKNQSLGGLSVSGSGTANAVVGGNPDISILTINNPAGNVTFSGILGGSGTNHENLALTKTLAGTLTLSGANAYIGDTTITGGVLALGANNVLPNDSRVIIGTATLDVGVFSDTVGSVDPTNADAKVNLGSGGTIAFGDSSGEVWTGGILDFTGTFVSGVSVRFGVDDLSLSPTQLSQIRINGASGSYTLSPTGYLLNGVTDLYAAWSGGEAFSADKNNDGVQNGLAWLLGAANPNANATGLLPTITQIGGVLKLNFDMLPASARDGANLFVEHSSDLGITDAWTSVQVPDASGGAAPVTFVIGGTSPLDVEATIASSQNAGGKLFARVRAAR